MRYEFTPFMVRLYALLLVLKLDQKYTTPSFFNGFTISEIDNLILAPRLRVILV